MVRFYINVHELDTVEAAEAMIVADSVATHGCRLSCNRLILVTALNGGSPFWLPHPRENHGVVEEEAWVLVARVG